MVGEIEWRDFLWETRNLAEKLVEATEVASDVEGGEVDEPLEEARKERACWTLHFHVSDVGRCLILKV